MRSFPFLGKGEPWGGNQPRILSGHGLQGLVKSFLERLACPGAHAAQQGFDRARTCLHR